MKEKNSKLEAFKEWVRYDLPENIPLMCIICPAMVGIGMAIAIPAIGLGIKLLNLIF